jgi:hypothetical protein
MKQALISPNEAPINYLSGWTTDNPPQPIWTPIANSCRVAEVSEQSFEVAPPLFWADCENDVTAEKYYYNTNDNNIYPVPAPAPNSIQDPTLTEIPPSINVTETIS